MTTASQQNVVPETLPQPVAGQSLWQHAWRRLTRDRGAVICAVIIALYVMVALGGAVYDAGVWFEWWPQYQPQPQYDQAHQAPSLDSWSTILGTDWQGKSVLVKTLLGAKVSLTVGFMANVIAVPLGLVLGSIAGYYGGRVDDVIVWLYSTLASIPGIVLLFAMRFAFRDVRLLGLDLTGIHGIYIALGVISWIGTCRLVRAETMKIRELDYVIASRACGRGGLSILGVHVMPNIFHIGIINFSLGFVGAIQAEVILSYLGLGVSVGTPSWGSMINGARMDLFAGRYWELTSAVAAMFLLVLALNIFGDRLRDALDPRLRGV